MDPSILGVFGWHCWSHSSSRNQTHFSEFLYRLERLFEEVDYLF